MFGNKTRIVPWFDKNNIYDNDMYFQMKGGWARNEGEADEPSKYECTISKTNFVNNIEELYEISYNYLNNGDIYYVNDEETYYKLININKHNSMEGWKGASIKEINELESIIDNNKGNNPHYGEYDGGQSYFNLIRNFFVSSEFSDVADSDIENKDKYGFIIQRQDDNIKVIDYLLEHCSHRPKSLVDDRTIARLLDRIPRDEGIKVYYKYAICTEGFGNLTIAKYCKNIEDTYFYLDYLLIFRLL